MEPCAIFIDGGYLAKILQSEFDSPRVDYQKLSDALAHGNERLRTYYYDCMPHKSSPPTSEEVDRYRSKQGFIHAVRRSVRRFQFRQGRLKEIGIGRYEQKGIDVQLAIDMVRLCSKQQIRTVILITGDADLVPAVEACKAEGAIVQLYGHFSDRPHRRSIADELLNVCDEHYKIDQDLISQVLLSDSQSSTDQ